ncbi:Aste57867_7709 [Aphanomyces stellatus]|uniref:Aste57867_7709 protein n=1 Tax=Aphanomyces stellatus TaxID=120398 RepID=A0A485KIP7_9STRA|nr:hypothetical protein As57867_007680 [Aphanomyces stellatus]VFT84612.1 Aste57867_7709 [Aphanomyces stellatus]
MGQSWYLLMVLAVTTASNVVYYRQDYSNNVIARSDDFTTRTIVDSPAWNKIIGMTVHEQAAKLYWSDGTVIWRSNIDGSSVEVFVGAFVSVTLQGYNFGASANDVTLTVLTYLCTSILSWSPTTVTCLLRIPAVASSNYVTPPDVTIQTPFGSTTGITPAINDLLSSKAYVKPLVSNISIQVTLLSPHTLAIDNFDATAKWLYFSSYVCGCIYRAHVQTMDATVWSVYGMSIFGTLLRYTVESKGTINLLDVSNTSNAPIVIIQNLKSPRGICVDHTNSVLYFVEKGGKIFKALTNGKSFSDQQQNSIQIQRLMGLSSFTRLNGIALDETNNMLYWSESNSNVIARAPLDILQRQIVIGGGPNSIISWPRHVHVTQSDALFFSEYGGRISSGAVGTNGPFNYILNLVTEVLMETNTPDQPMHFYGLE